MRATAAEGWASSGAIPNAVNSPSTEEPHGRHRHHPGERRNHQPATPRRACLLRRTGPDGARRQHLHAGEQPDPGHQKHADWRPAQRLEGQLRRHELPHNHHVNHAHAHDSQARQHDRPSKPQQTRNERAHRQQGRGGVADLLRQVEPLWTNGGRTQRLKRDAFVAQCQLPPCLVQLAKRPGVVPPLDAQSPDPGNRCRTKSCCRYGSAI